MPRNFGDFTLPTIHVLHTANGTAHQGVPVIRDSSEVPPTPLKRAERPSGLIKQLDLVKASNLQPESIRWLWPGWLAQGKFHVLAGAPGTGKTTLAIHFAACVSAGLPMPDGSVPKAGDVLIWSGEDDPNDTLLPRLIAAGADTNRVHFIGDVRVDGKLRSFDPANDIDKLADEAKKLASVALLIVDPVVSAISGDSHKNAEVRRGLAPLVSLAGRLDAALLGITHYSKGTQGRTNLDRITGSVAFGAVARLVLSTVERRATGGNAATKILVRAKSNIGPDGNGFPYSLEQFRLVNNAEIVTSRIFWGPLVTGSAQDLLREPEPERKADPGNKEIDGLLSNLLRDGPVPVKVVLDEAIAAGYSRDQVRRSKGRLGISTKKESMAGGWVWSLPESAAGEDVEESRQV